MSVSGTGMLFYNLLNDPHKHAPIILQPSPRAAAPSARGTYQSGISAHIAQLLNRPMLGSSPTPSNAIRAEPANGRARVASNGMANAKNGIASMSTVKSTKSNAKSANSYGRTQTAHRMSPISNAISPKSNAMPSMPLLSTPTLSSSAPQCQHTKCRLHHHMDTLKMLTTNHLAALKGPRRLRPKLMVYPRPIHDHNHFPIFDFAIDTSSSVT